MVTKHFLKTIVIFIGLIGLGLLGIFISSFFDSGGNGESLTTTSLNTSQ